MTEYNASPEAIQEYMTSKERTAHWVTSYEPSQFYSPSVPPSVLDDPDILQYEPSDSEAESTHSLPPKMLLKYGDGRPDISISHWHYDSRPAPPQRHGSVSTHVPAGRSGSIHSRSKSGSHADYISAQHSQPMLRTPSRRSRQSEPYTVPPSPEEIRVLPSQIDETPKSILQQPSRHSHRSQSGKSRSPESISPKSLYPPSHHTQLPPDTRLSSSYVHVPSNISPSLSPTAYSQSQPYLGHTSHSRSGSRSPPAIVYAPAHRSRGNYAPPAMVYSHNPPPVRYSQSAPNPQSKYVQYPHTGATPYHSGRGTPQLSSVDEEMWIGRGRSRSPGAAQVRAPIQRDSSRAPSQAISRSDSHDSGSTYYILPTPGQKVQIIVPEGGRSVYTATSATKSPTSPQSPSFKKPFFQRLFHIAEKFSSVDSRGSIGKRLHRRHSTGGSGRSRSTSH